MRKLLFSMAGPLDPSITDNYRVARIERPNNQSLFELILNISGKSKTVYTDEHGNTVRFNK